MKILTHRNVKKDKSPIFLRFKALLIGQSIIKRNITLNKNFKHTILSMYIVQTSVYTVQHNVNATGQKPKK